MVRVNGHVGNLIQAESRQNTYDPQYEWCTFNWLMTKTYLIPKVLSEWENNFDKYFTMI